MDPRRPPEYTLEISADRSSMKDVVKAILHMIFFHRYFTPLYPATHEVLDLTLPYVSEDDVETLIETRTSSLLRHIDTQQQQQQQQRLPPQQPQIILQFLERKRRKTWFVSSASEDTVWETWSVDVTLLPGSPGPQQRRLMEKTLHRAAMKVLAVVGRDKAHIPPITTNESNPFPYQILVKEKAGGGVAGKGMESF